MSEMRRRLEKFQVHVGVWEKSAEGRSRNGKKISPAHNHYCSLSFRFLLTSLFANQAHEEGGEGRGGEGELANYSQ